MSHVLWIGGPQAAGKTTIGKWLAHKHDLRLYHCDAHTYERVERARSGNFPALQEWMQLSSDEQWVTGSADEMADLFLRCLGEGFRMILDDIQALPPEPMILVEGVHVLPNLVSEAASSSHALILLPTNDLQRERLEQRTGGAADNASDPIRARANIVERNFKIAQAIKKQLEGTDLPTLEVEGTSNFYELEIQVEKHFAGALRANTAIDDEARSELRRFENLDVLQNLTSFAAAVPNRGEPVTYRFSCECHTKGCMKRVDLTLEEYQKVVESGILLIHPDEAT